MKKRSEKHVKNQCLECNGMTMFRKIALAALLLVPLSGYAASDIKVSHSQAGQGKAPYVGISLGSADYDLANDSSPSFSIFGGMALNELLAIELGMIDFGDATNAAVKSEVSAFYGSVLANSALSSELSAFVQLGLASWDYDVASASDSSVDVFWGLGLNYEVSQGLAARLAIQQFSIDASFASISREEEILNISLGLIYRF